MFSAENNFEKNDSVLCTAEEIMRHLGKKRSFIAPVADRYFYNKALHLNIHQSFRKPEVNHLEVPYHASTDL